jgi:hypothetical protein
VVPEIRRGVSGRGKIACATGANAILDRIRPRLLTRENGALLNGERMSDIAALERLKIAIRTRISVLVGLVTIAGWLLSRVPSKRQRIDARDRDQDINPHSLKIMAGSKQPKSGGGLLSLTLQFKITDQQKRFFSPYWAGSLAGWALPCIVLR